MEKLFNGDLIKSEIKVDVLVIGESKKINNYSEDGTDFMSIDKSVPIKIINFSKHIKKDNCSKDAANSLIGKFIEFEGDIIWKDKAKDDWYLIDDASGKFKILDLVYYNKLDEIVITKFDNLEFYCQ